MWFYTTSRCVESVLWKHKHTTCAGGLFLSHKVGPAGVHTTTVSTLWLSRCGSHGVPACLFAPCLRASRIGPFAPTHQSAESRPPGVRPLMLVASQLHCRMGTQRKACSMEPQRVCILVHSTNECGVARSMWFATRSAMPLGRCGAFWHAVPAAGAVRLSICLIYVVTQSVM